MNPSKDRMAKERAVYQATVKENMRHEAAMAKLLSDVKTPPPEKGVHYFTEEEIEAIKNDILSMIPKPKDGVSPEVNYQLIQDYCAIEIARHISSMPIPKDGKPGPKGEKGDTPIIDMQALVNQVLLAIPKQKDRKLVIDRQQILDLVKEEIKKIPPQPVRVGGSVASIRALTDVILTGVPQDERGNYILTPGGGSLPSGGTTSQVLTKLSDADGDADWQTPSGGGISDGDKGDITVSGGGTVWTIDNQAVTRPKLEHIQSEHFLGRHAAGTGDVQEVSPVQARTILSINNVDNTSDANKPISTATQTALNAKYDASNPSGFETPAQLNARDTANRSRANHTGTQLASTISDFAEAVDDEVASLLVAGSNITLTYNDSENTLTIAASGGGGSGAVAVEAVFDGQGALPTVNSKAQKARINSAMTITGWTIYLFDVDGNAVTGSCVIDIWKDTYANFPATVADTITGSAKPTATSANKAQSTTLTGWTTSLAVGDHLIFNLDSVSGAGVSKVLLALHTS